LNSKKTSNNGLIYKQTNIYGNIIEEEREENVQLLKSVLQKAVRRGMDEKAAYAAHRLSNKKTGWILWRRLAIISAEDALDPLIITAVDVLRREAKEFGYDTWDGKRCAVAAALLMLDSKKDRRADEFLELMDAIEKHGEETPELKEVKEVLERIPDEALDMHTREGRKMGRGLRYWYEVSSETENKTEAYQKWKAWWKPLMLKTIEKEGKRK